MTSVRSDIPRQEPYELPILLCSDGIVLEGLLGDVLEMPPRASLTEPSLFVVSSLTVRRDPDPLQPLTEGSDPFGVPAAAVSLGLHLRREFT